MTASANIRHNLTKVAPTGCTKDNHHPCESYVPSGTLQPIKNEHALYIKVKGVIRRVNIYDIIMVEADDNYSTLYFSDGSNVYTARTLKSWANEIQNADMLRVHRSYLINRKHIASINLKTNYIQLSNGMQVSTSRRKRIFTKSSLIS
jgi:DNA-binding LytR/AlgR family response regulator